MARPSSCAQEGVCGLFTYHVLNQIHVAQNIPKRPSFIASTAVNITWERVASHEFSQANQPPEMGAIQLSHATAEN